MSLLDGLRVHYKLNESSGQRNDSHTNARHLTDNNTVPSRTMVLGNGASFDDANSEYLSHADNTDFEFSGDLRLCAGWRLII